MHFGSRIFEPSRIYIYTVSATARQLAAGVIRGEKVFAINFDAIADVASEDERARRDRWEDGIARGA